MGSGTKNSTNMPSWSHGPSAPLKRGSVWLVCHYRLADVKGSVTCLVKRKEFEGRAERERGLLCKQLH